MKTAESVLQPVPLSFFMPRVFLYHSCGLLLWIFAQPLYNILAFVEGLTVNEETGDLFFSALLHKALQISIIFIDVADRDVCPSLLINLPANQMAVRACRSDKKLQFHMDPPNYYLLFYRFARVIVNNKTIT